MELKLIFSKIKKFGKIEKIEKGGNIVELTSTVEPEEYQQRQSDADDSPVSNTIEKLNHFACN